MVHHTSFLWDYEAANMSLLKLPQRRPDYRRDRPHQHFLTTLKLVSPRWTHMGASAQPRIQLSTVESGE